MTRLTAVSIIQQSVHWFQARKRWGVLLLLGLLWPFGRWGLSLYHQTQGVWLVVRALQAETAQRPGYGGVWMQEPLQTAPARQLVTTAAAHFRAMYRARSDHGPAYRWAGRSAALLGDAQTAIEDFSDYTTLVPQDTLGWWELGMAYERLAAQAGIVPAAALTTTQASAVSHRPPIAPVARAAAAWQRGGLTVQDFIRVGENARLYQHPGVIEWYGRAVWLNPELGDAWYHTGLFYETQQAWPAALAAYEQAAHQPLDQLGISTLYYRMGLTYQQMQDRQYWGLVLEFYEKALALQQFNTSAEAADCHYNYGAVWLWQSGDWDKAMAEFEAALALYPTHAGAHLMRGWGLYKRDGNEAEAEREMLMAVALAPQGAWVYHNLGEFYRLTGRSAEARLQYQKALELNPTLQEVREALSTLDTYP